MNAAGRPPSKLSDIPDSERLRALERIIPEGHVQAALKKAGQDKRHCPRLSRYWVLYFLVAMALFSDDSQADVFGRLRRFRPAGAPQSNTIAMSREATGVAPIRLLARDAVRLLGEEDTPGAFYKGMRTVALDGTLLDAQDTPDNARAFGRPNSGLGEGAFPQVLVLALCETGSRVLWRWQAKPGRRGEAVVAPTLLRHLQPDMLLLEDRGLLCHKTAYLVRKARKAHLLARAKTCIPLPPEEALPDGSSLSTLRPSSRATKKQRETMGVRVRVVDYTLHGTGHEDDGKPHRLVTTLLDHEEYPAEELILLYHERWEQELAFDELKTHLLKRRRLRSKAPAGVVQEIEGLMLAHFVVRAVMQEAAEAEGYDPDRLSFTGTLQVLHCRLPEVPKGAGRVKLKEWWQKVLEEVTQKANRPREGRVNPRVVKKQLGKWKKKKPCHLRPPPPIPFKEAILLHKHVPL